MRAKFLIDNITHDEFQSEWGLSVYIETDGRRILLDTGKSNLFFENAKALDIDLNTVDAAVLSHAHYDHSDGMDVFFEHNKKAKFYLRESAGENCYHKLFIWGRYIGIKKGIITDYANRIEYVAGDYKLFDNVYLIPHKTPDLANLGKASKMYIKKGVKLVPDDFSHEQSLVIDTDKGLVIFNSCSHGGADNIINEIKKTFPDKEIYAMIGGFHLFDKSDSEIRAFAKRVKDTGIAHVITGHCTGGRAYKILEEELGDKVTQIYSGLEVTV